MFRFDLIVQRACKQIKGLQFPFGRLTFQSFALSGATLLSTFMSSTVQSCLAQFGTLGRVCCSLMTNHMEGVPTTAARRGDLEVTRSTFADVAQLLATMSTGQLPTTLLLTARDWILAVGTNLPSKIFECSLATGAVSYNVDRPGTVRRSRILRMTRLLATVNATIHDIVTHVSTVEGAHPICALLLLTSSITFQLLLDFATIAPCINFGSTSTTKAFMAGTLTCVLTTGHHVAAFCTASPAGLVIGFHTASGSLLLPAEATLFRTHGRARWAWTGVTKKVTGVRTCLGELSLTATGLSTGVWGKASDHLGIQFFLTPTTVRIGGYVFRKIATGAPPLLSDCNTLLVLTRSPLHGRAFILGPSLDTPDMKDCPACPARPHLGIPADFVGTYGTLVDSAGDVFVDSCGDVRCSGAGKGASPRLRILLCRLFATTRWMSMSLRC